MPATTLPGDVKAHLAVPPVGAGPWPGVVVLHESFGLNDDIRQQADRLAAAGYLAVAPDLYSAGGAWRCIRATFTALTRGHGKAFDDIEAARSWLAARGDCSGRVGVVGFCMGGGFALLTAARGFDASAPNYAHLPKDLDGALEGACPVVASFGGRDVATREVREKLPGQLDALGVPHDIKIYPDAGHSFYTRTPGVLGQLSARAPIYAHYHEASAQDAHRRIVAFFREHL